MLNADKKLRPTCKELYDLSFFNILENNELDELRDSNRKLLLRIE